MKFKLFILINDGILPSKDILMVSIIFEYLIII